MYYHNQTFILYSIEESMMWYDYSVHCDVERPTSTHNLYINCHGDIPPKICYLYFRSFSHLTFWEMFYIRHAISVFIKYMNSSYQLHKYANFFCVISLVKCALEYGTLSMLHLDYFTLATCRSLVQKLQNGSRPSSWTNVLRLYSTLV